MIAWWVYLVVTVLALTAVGVALLIEAERRFLLRLYGECGWLGCGRPADGGDGLCRKHMEAITGTGDKV